MKLPVFKRDGTPSSQTIEIPDALLSGEPNDHAIWLAVRSEQAARHQGTHATKTRSFVRGGGRKPFKQKGRGMARQGSSRSPLMPGGSTIFGPQPHKYHVGMPEKVRRLARRSALLYKARDNSIRVVEDFTLEVPRTREMAGLISALGAKSTRVLFLTPEFNTIMALSVKNIPGAAVQKAEAASTLDLMNCCMVVLQQSAVPQLMKVLNHAA
jgi:large subunit ribosomal protein L4